MRVGAVVWKKISVKIIHNYDCKYLMTCSLEKKLNINLLIPVQFGPTGIH